MTLCSIFCKIPLKNSNSLFISRFYNFAWVAGYPSLGYKRVTRVTGYPSLGYRRVARVTGNSITRVPVHRVEALVSTLIRYIAEFIDDYDDGLNICFLDITDWELRMKSLRITENDARVYKKVVLEQKISWRKNDGEKTVFGPHWLHLKAQSFHFHSQVEHCCFHFSFFVDKLLCFSLLFTLQLSCRRASQDCLFISHLANPCTYLNGHKVLSGHHCRLEGRLWYRPQQGSPLWIFIKTFAARKRS